MRAGMAAAQRNDLPLAQREFTRAVSLAPQIAASHAALGSVLLAQGELAAAAKELARAHQLAPQDVGASLNLARTQSLLGHFAESRQLFDQTLATSPALSEEESLAYAAALSATGDPAHAEAQLAGALRRSPDSAALLDAQGTLYANDGRLDQAEASFARAVALDPQPQHEYHLGVALFLLGRPVDAIFSLRQAAAALPANFDVHLQLGRALSAAHEDEPALVELHRAQQLQSGPIAPATAYALALSLEASGDPAASLPLFRIAMTTSSPSSDSFTNAALAHVQTGDAAGALPLYARALALGPDSAILREDYGVAFLQQSDLDHAIAQFRSGLALDPTSTHLHYDLGLAFKLKDDLAAAIPELERAAELDPTLPDPSYTLGILFMQQGNSERAATQFRRATDLQPTNEDAWALLASVLKDSDGPAATAALTRAIALKPDQPSLHIQLAALLVHAGQPAQAAAERKLAADLSRAAVAHQRATFALNSGRSLLAEGKLPEAVDQLTIATDADPKLAEAHRLLAQALTRQGKTAEAALERQRMDSSAPPAVVTTPNLK